MILRAGVYPIQSFLLEDFYPSDANFMYILFDVEKQKNICVFKLMNSPPEILFSTENMQSAMEKFERSGVWNLPVVENNTYLGFVFKAKIFNA